MRLLFRYVRRAQHYYKFKSNYKQNQTMSKNFVELKSSTIQEWTGLTGEDCNLELTQVKSALQLNVGRMQILMRENNLSHEVAAIMYPVLAERIVRLAHWLECINKASGAYGHSVSKKANRDEIVAATLKNYKYIAKEVPMLVRYRVESPDGKHRTFILTTAAHEELRRHLNPVKASVKDVKRYVEKMKRSQEHGMKI